MFKRIKLYFYRRKLEKQRQQIAKNALEAGRQAAESIKSATVALGAFAKGLREAQTNERDEDDEA